MATDEWPLMLYTIYQRPLDMADPGLPFAVRGFEIRAGGPVPGRAVWAPTLDAARALVPAGADCRLPRAPQDPAQIVESWM